MQQACMLLIQYMASTAQSLTENGLDQTCTAALVSAHIKHTPACGKYLAIEGSYGMPLIHQKEVTTRATQCRCYDHASMTNPLGYALAPGSCKQTVSTCSNEPGCRYCTLIS